MGIIIIPGQIPEEQEPAAEHMVSPEALRELVHETVERNAKVKRTNPLQEKHDQLIADCYAAEEIELAAALSMIQAAHCSRVLHWILEDLMQSMADMFPIIQLNQACRNCGCTNERACEGGCDWVEFDLCSRCASQADGLWHK